MDESAKDSFEIQTCLRLIEKLTNPLAEIRTRASQNLLFKLQSRLWRVETLEHLAVKSRFVYELLCEALYDQLSTFHPASSTAIALLDWLVQRSSRVREKLTILNIVPLLQNLLAKESDETQQVLRKIIQGLDHDKDYLQSNDFKDVNNINSSDPPGVDGDQQNSNTTVSSSFIWKPNDWNQTEAVVNGLSLPHVLLTQSDEQFLLEFEVQLKTEVDTVKICSMCDSLQHLIFNSFPVNVFLQKPSILEYLLHLLKLPILVDSDILDIDGNDFGVHYFQEWKHYSHKSKGTIINPYLSEKSDRGNLHQSNFAVFFTALNCIEEILRLLREDSRLHLDPSMQVKKASCDLDVANGRFFIFPFPNSMKHPQRCVSVRKSVKQTIDSTDIVMGWSISGFVFYALSSIIPLLLHQSYPRVYLLGLIDSCADLLLADSSRIIVKRLRGCLSLLNNVAIKCKEELGRKLNSHTCESSKSAVSSKFSMAYLLKVINSCSSVKYFFSFARVLVKFVLMIPSKYFEEFENIDSRSSTIENITLPAEILKLLSELTLCDEIFKIDPSFRRNLVPILVKIDKNVDKWSRNQNVRNQNLKKMDKFIQEMEIVVQNIAQDKNEIALDEENLVNILCSARAAMDLLHQFQFEGWSDKQGVFCECIICLLIIASNFLVLKTEESGMVISLSINISRKILFGVMNDCSGRNCNSSAVVLFKLLVKFLRFDSHASDTEANNNDWCRLSNCVDLSCQTTFVKHIIIADDVFLTVLFSRLSTMDVSTPSEQALFLNDYEDMFQTPEENDNNLLHLHCFLYCVLEIWTRSLDIHKQANHTLFQFIPYLQHITYRHSSESINPEVCQNKYKVYKYKLLDMCYELCSQSEKLLSMSRCLVHQISSIRKSAAYGLLPLVFPNSNTSINHAKESGLTINLMPEHYFDVPTYDRRAYKLILEDPFGTVKDSLIDILAETVPQSCRSQTGRKAFPAPDPLSVSRLVETIEKLCNLFCTDTLAVSIRLASLEQLVNLLHNRGDVVSTNTLLNAFRVTVESSILVRLVDHVFILLESKNTDMALQRSCLNLLQTLLIIDVEIRKKIRQCNSKFITILRFVFHPSIQFRGVAYLLILCLTCSLENWVGIHTWSNACNVDTWVRNNEGTYFPEFITESFGLLSMCWKDKGICTISNNQFFKDILTVNKLEQSKERKMDEAANENFQLETEFSCSGLSLHLLCWPSIESFLSRITHSKSHNEFLNRMFFLVETVNNIRAESCQLQEFRSKKWLTAFELFFKKTPTSSKDIVVLISILQLWTKLPLYMHAENMNELMLLVKVKLVPYLRPKSSFMKRGYKVPTYNSLLVIRILQFLLNLCAAGVTNFIHNLVVDTDLAGILYTNYLTAEISTHDEYLQTLVLELLHVISISYTRSQVILPRGHISISENIPLDESHESALTMWDSHVALLIPKVHKIFSRYRIVDSFQSKCLYYKAIMCFDAIVYYYFRRAHSKEGKQKCASIMINCSKDGSTNNEVFDCSSAWEWLFLIFADRDARIRKCVIKVMVNLLEIHFAIEGNSDLSLFNSSSLKRIQQLLMSTSVNSSESSTVRFEALRGLSACIRRYFIHHADKETDEIDVSFFLEKNIDDFVEHFVLKFTHTKLDEIDCDCLVIFLEIVLQFVHQNSSSEFSTNIVDLLEKQVGQTELWILLSRFSSVIYHFDNFQSRIRAISGASVKKSNMKNGYFTSVQKEIWDSSFLIIAIRASQFAVLLISDMIDRDTSKLPFFLNHSSLLLSLSTNFTLSEKVANYAEFFSKNKIESASFFENNFSALSVLIRRANGLNNFSFLPSPFYKSSILKSIAKLTQPQNPLGLRLSPCIFIETATSNQDWKIIFDDFEQCHIVLCNLLDAYYQIYGMYELQVTSQNLPPKSNQYNEPRSYWLRELNLVSTCINVLFEHNSDLCNVAAQEKGFLSFLLEKVYALYGKLRLHHSLDCLSQFKCTENSFRQIHWVTTVDVLIVLCEGIRALLYKSPNIQDLAQKNGLPYLLFIIWPIACNLSSTPSVPKRFNFLEVLLGILCNYVSGNIATKSSIVFQSSTPTRLLSTNFSITTLCVGPKKYKRDLGKGSLFHLLMFFVIERRKIGWQIAESQSKYRIDKGKVMHQHIRLEKTEDSYVRFAILRLSREVVLCWKVLQSLILNQECFKVAIKCGFISFCVNELQYFCVNFLTKWKRSDYVKIKSRRICIADLKYPDSKPLYQMKYLHMQVEHIIDFLANMAFSEPGQEALSKYNDLTEILVDVFEADCSNNDEIKRIVLAGSYLVKNLSYHKALKSQFLVGQHLIPAFLSCMLACNDIQIVCNLSSTVWSLLYNNSKAKVVFASEDNMEKFDQIEQEFCSEKHYFSSEKFQGVSKNLTMIRALLETHPHELDNR